MSFPVRALYAYQSEQSDDLPFDEGQVITVTEVLDEDWYAGTYTSADGKALDGIFPINYVEKIEAAQPAAPALPKGRPLSSTKPIETKPEDEDDWGSAPEDDGEEKEIVLGAPDKLDTTALTPPPASNEADPPVSKSIDTPKVELAKEVDKAPPVDAGLTEASTDSAPTQVEHDEAKEPLNSDETTKPAEVSEEKAAKALEPTEQIKPAAKAAARPEFKDLRPNATEDEGDPSESLVSNFKSRMAIFNQPKAEEAKPDVKPPPRRTTTQFSFNSTDEDIQLEVKPVPPKKFGSTFEPVEDEAEPRKPAQPEDEEEESNVPRLSLKERIQQLQQRQEEERRALEEAEERLKQRQAERQAELQARKSALSDQQASAAGSVPQLPGSDNAEAGDQVVEDGSPEPTGGQDSAGVAADQPKAAADSDEVDEADDEEEARKIALRERMARLHGGMGGFGLGGPPRRESRAPRELEAMSKEEREREEARLALENAQPVSVMGLGGGIDAALMKRLGRAQPETDPEVASDNGDDEPADEPADEEAIQAALELEKQLVEKETVEEASAEEELQPPADEPQRTFASAPPVPTATATATATTTSAPPAPTKAPALASAPPVPGARPAPPVPTGSAGGAPPVPVTTAAPSVSEAPRAVEEPKQPKAESMPRTAPPVPPQPPVNVSELTAPSDLADEEDNTDSDAEADAEAGDARQGSPRHDIPSSLRPPAPPAPPIVPAVPPPVDRPVSSSSGDADIDTDVPPTSPTSHRSAPPTPTTRPPPPVPPSQAPSTQAPPVPGHPVAPHPATRAPPVPGSAPPVPTQTYSRPPAPPPAPPTAAPAAPAVAAPAAPTGRAPPVPTATRAPPPIPSAEPQPTARPSGQPPRPPQPSQHPLPSPPAASTSQLAPVTSRGSLLDTSSNWHSEPRGVPPALRTMQHVVYEVEESETTKRGGRVVLNRDIYILRPDLSQTVINVSFDRAAPEQAQIEKHEQAPPHVDAAVLKTASARYGSAIVSAASRRPPTDLAAVKSLLASIKGLLPAIDDTFGYSIYENFGSSVHQVEELRAGDIAVFDEAHFQGSKSPLQKYHRDVSGAFIVSAWDGAKKKLHLVDTKKDTVRLGDLRSGSIRIYRALGRDLVGWDN